MFEAGLARSAEAVSAEIVRAIAALPAGPLSEAMAYSCHGGKRLRGFLVLEGAMLHDEPEDRALRAGAAIEMLHAYSLVHDDLPCMDDDDLRRGQPTVHRKWDEATAVLVGDALQSLAFDILSDPATHPLPERRLALVSGLARAAGAAGMVLGQARDIAAETAAAPLDLDAITELQALKTGALIEWAGTAGPLLAGADPTALRDYSRALGLAFQIADDILDVTGDEARAGKRLNKDAARGKATFVSLLGLEGARARAREMTAVACEALAPYGERADRLREAARFVVSRDI